MAKYPFEVKKKGYIINHSFLVKQAMIELLENSFPKTMDINQSDSYVEAKMKEINLRPRKCLNWKTPYEVYHSVELHLT